MRSDAKPNGMVIMNRKLTTAAAKYPTAIHRPPNISQITFRVRRISPPAVLPDYPVAVNGGARQAGIRVGSEFNIASCAGGTLLVLPIPVIVRQAGETSADRQG